MRKHNPKYPWISKTGVIENRPGFVKICTECLGELGVTPYVASSYGEAIALIRSVSLDIAIVDKNLQKEEAGSEGDELGLDVLRAFQEAGDDTFLCLATAWASVPSAVESLRDLGCADYLDKEEFIPRTKGIATLRRLFDRANTRFDEIRREPEFRRRCEGMVDLVMTSGHADRHLNNVARGIGSHGAELREMIFRVLTDFFPIVSEVTGRSVLRLHSEAALGIANIWSRGVGKACLLIVGPIKTLGVLDQIKLDFGPFIGKSQLIADFSDLRLLEQLDQGNQRACVYELPCLDPPTARRAYQMVPGGI